MLILVLTYLDFQRIVELISVIVDGLVQDLTLHDDALLEVTPHAPLEFGQAAISQRAVCEAPVASLKAIVNTFGVPSHSVPRYSFR